MERPETSTRRRRRRRLWEDLLPLLLLLVTVVALVGWCHASPYAVVAAGMFLTAAVGAWQKLRAS